MVAMAELHCHIEGAAAPELVERQARKYGADTSRFIQNGAFVWEDFTTFLAAYDFSADLFRDEDDYALLADLSARLEAVTAERDEVETEWLTAAAVLE